MLPVLLLGYVMPKLRSQAVEAGLIADVDTVEEKSSDCKSVQSASRTGASTRQGAQAAYQKFKTTTFPAQSRESATVPSYSSPFRTTGAFRSAWHSR
jgi:hypothetical protein